MTPGEIHLVPRPTPLTTDLFGWLTTFARNTFFSQFSDADANELMLEVEEMCRPDNYWSNATPGIGIKGDAAKGVKGADPQDGWEMMYVRLRGTATRNGDA
jgi:hypothetical protein